MSAANATIVNKSSFSDLKLVDVYNNVEHPNHYTSHPSGIEIYLITQEMLCPNLSNAFKYMARHLLKGKPAEDILKAHQYVRFEIDRRNQFTFSLPEPVRTKYEPRYEPFYVYIAHEPDQHMKGKLIQLWDADKSDAPNMSNTLAQLDMWLLNLAAEYEKREREGDRLLQALDKTERIERRDQVHIFRKEMENGEIPDWNEWQISLPEGWVDINGYRVIKGGKIELHYSGDDGNVVEARGPRDIINMRQKENYYK